MNWKTVLKEFKNYLILEKGLSKNTIDAYVRDVKKLENFITTNFKAKKIINIDQYDLSLFIKKLNTENKSRMSQSRIISGIKSFFIFLQNQNKIYYNPILKIDRPKISKKLPDILSIEEIDQIIKSVDLSSFYGERNRAILEVLYSCGVRVSELVNLKCSKLNITEKFIIVKGKGNKERIIPLSKVLLNYINSYFNNYRSNIKIALGCEDFIFLSRRGLKLTRMMIFNIVKKHVILSGIKKKISPHSFRHSFASHLITGGANLRAIQTMLGHENISTTEIYMHLDKNFIREEILLHHPRK